MATYSLSYFAIRDIILDHAETLSEILSLISSKRKLLEIYKDH